MQAEQTPAEGELICICVKPNDFNCIILKDNCVMIMLPYPKCHFVTSLEGKCDFNHTSFGCFPEVQMFCFY